MAKQPHKPKFIQCEGCGALKEWPTRETDTWHACWCEKPDRCTVCGPCQECFPGVAAGAGDSCPVVLGEERCLDIQARFG